MNWVILKERFSVLYIDIIKPTVNNFIAIGSFIYLVVQLIAIFFEIRIIIPEEFRPLTMWIAFSLIILSMGYYWTKSIFKRAEERIKKAISAKDEEIKKAISAKDEEIKKAIRNLKEVKDPKIDVEELTYRDIEFSIYCLTKQLISSDFLFYADKATPELDTEKNLIIGIDRGGSIVGGLLAKSLRLTLTNLAIYYADPPITAKGIKTSIRSAKCLENVDFSRVKSVLLVDDAVRTGESLKAAIEILKKIKATHEFEYRKVSILNYPYLHRRVENPDFFVFKTKNIDLKLPWDVHWDTMPDNDDFDNLCSKISKITIEQTEK